MNRHRFSRRAVRLHPGRATALVILTLAELGGRFHAAGADWPQWRGPTRDGVVPSACVPAPWRDSDHASVLLAPEHLLCLTNPGELVVVRRAARAFQVERRYRLTSDETWATPAFLEDGLVLRDTKHFLRLAGAAVGHGTNGRLPERRPGEDQVEVTLIRGFWMGKFEATQGQWKRVMGALPGELTAQLPEGDDFPVGNVNFAETEAFCQKLTELARQSDDLPKDWEFRLPTEAQWEYACRAGTTTATSFGDQLSSQQANFRGKPYNGADPGPSLNRAAKVGSYPANAWGLHDMHGNIYEWCRDWYHSKLPGGLDPDLYSAQSTAALNRTGDHARVRRGGAWTDDGWALRTAFRLRFEPHRRYDHIGFRVVIVRP